MESLTAIVIQLIVLASYVFAFAAVLVFFVSTPNARWPPPTAAVLAVSSLVLLGWFFSILR